MQNLTDHPTDKEAAALAACYRLLLQKARERRERLKNECLEETAVSSYENSDPDNQVAQDDGIVTD